MKSRAPPPGSGSEGFVASRAEKARGEPMAVRSPVIRGQLQGHFRAAGGAGEAAGEPEIVLQLGGVLLDPGRMQPVRGRAGRAGSVLEDGLDLADDVPGGIEALDRVVVRSQVQALPDVHL